VTVSVSEFCFPVCLLLISMFLYCFYTACPVLVFNTFHSLLFLSLTLILICLLLLLEFYYLDLSQICLVIESNLATTSLIDFITALGTARQRTRLIVYIIFVFFFVVICLLDVVCCWIIIKSNQIKLLAIRLLPLCYVNERYGL